MRKLIDKVYNIHEQVSTYKFYIWRTVDKYGVQPESSFDR